MSIHSALGTYSFLSLLVAAAPRAQDALPLAFVANQGQWASDVAFGARAAGARVWFGQASLTVEMRPANGTSHAVRLAFAGARAAPPRGVGETPTRYHFLRGADPASWRTFVPAYRGLRWESLYDGIDVTVRDGGGFVEYDLLLDAGADPRAVIVAVEGATGLRLLADGSLEAATAAGALRQPRPSTWQVLADGSRRALPCRYVVLGADRFGFAIERRAPGSRLVIDPGLLWSTYLGAGVEDEVRAVALTATGEAVVAGRTSSPLFPATGQALQKTWGGGGTSGGDAFVAQIAADGRSLAWCTFLGGSADDVAHDVAVGASGTIAIAGQTASANFPTTGNALARTLRGVDAFAARLDSTGSQLLYGSYVGGPSTEDGRAVHLDEAQNLLYVAGTTDGALALTATAFQNLLRGPKDGFLAIIHLAGNPTTLRYATYFGGNGSEDQVNDMHVAPTGIVTMVGVTRSSDFPTTSNAFQGSARSASDGCLICLQPTLSGTAGQVYGTYYGGGGDADVPMATHLSPAGILTIAGRTDSTDLAASSAVAPFQGMHAGGTDDGFVGRIDTAQSGAAALVYASYLGGSSADGIAAAAVDASGNVLTLAGATRSSAFPVTPLAFQTRSRGGEEGFVVKVDATKGGAAGLTYGTLVGGCPADDKVQALAVDAQGVATVGGVTQSTGFPVTLGPFQPVHAGGVLDGFVTRLDLQPYPAPGTVALGSGCPGTTGTAVLAGAADAQLCLPFSVQATGLRANQVAWVVFGLSKTIWGTTPLPLDLGIAGMPGCKLWISADLLFLTPYGGTTMSFGFPMPNDASMVGAQFYQQIVSADAGANAAGLVATNAVEATIRM